MISAIIWIKNYNILDEHFHFYSEKGKILLYWKVLRNVKTTLLDKFSDKLVVVSKKFSLERRKKIGWGIVSVSAPLHHDKKFPWKAFKWANFLESNSVQYEFY